MLRLLTAGFTIAIWQAIEVLARIQQILWYQEKFSNSTDPIHPITAGQSATALFIAGTMIGVLICFTGMRRASRFESRRWRAAFILPLGATALFGVAWIALIASPFVDLHAR